MQSLTLLLLLGHYLGFALALGAATSKTALLLKTRKAPSFVPVFLAASKTLTRLIITGLSMAVVSGLAWLGLGLSDMSARLWAKIALVATVFAVGPLIDNVFEPRFRSRAPQPGEAETPAFVAARNRYVGVELLATALLYSIIVLWLSR